MTIEALADKLEAVSSLGGYIMESKEAAQIVTALRSISSLSAATATWQPIETVPKMKNILLWAATDIGDDGAIRNWKMDTGYWSSGAECWTWSGYQVRKYDIHPTHWQPLPAAPVG
jgi:hypothetical protein